MDQDEVTKAMAEVEEKVRAFTEAHRGESAEDILAQMRGEEPASEDLEEEIEQYCLHHGYLDSFKNCGYTFNEQVGDIARYFANWQKEQINVVLLSEVLPCFMHGGEADEVVAKLEEVLNKKK